MAEEIISMSGVTTSGDYVETPKETVVEEVPIETPIEVVKPKVFMPFSVARTISSVDATEQVIGFTVDVENKTCLIRKRISMTYDNGGKQITSGIVSEVWLSGNKFVELFGADFGSSDLITEVSQKLYDSK